MALPQGFQHKCSVHQGLHVFHDKPNLTGKELGYMALPHLGCIMQQGPPFPLVSCHVLPDLRSRMFLMRTFRLMT